MRCARNNRRAGVDRAQGTGAGSPPPDSRHVTHAPFILIHSPLLSSSLFPLSFPFFPPSLSAPHPDLSLPSHAREVVGAIVASCRPLLPPAAPAPVAVPARGAVALLVVSRGGRGGVLTADGVPQRRLAGYRRRDQVRHPPFYPRVPVV